MPTFTGTTGNETLTGTTDADILISNGGSDTIFGDDGDDTIIVISQVTGYGTLNGGAGIDTLQIDRALAPVTVNGSVGSYQLNLAVLSNTATTTLTSLERLAFNSQAGDVMNVQLAYGGNSGAANQIGAGLAANATIVGGAGQDLLILLYNSANLPGTVTAPSFTFNNWDTPTRAYLGDRVTIGVTGSGDTTLNGSAHTGVQGLNGGSGNDTINGSNDMDLISGGAGGNDQMFGNGGDDTLFLINTYFINGGTGVAGAETTRTGSGSLFDGGTGTDFLMLGGNVNFQGTIQNIEGLLLLPGYTNTNAGATIQTTSQYNTFVEFTYATFSALPSNLLVAGAGYVLIRAGAAGDTINISTIVRESGSSVLFDLRGSAGNDTLTGTNEVDYFASSGGVDVMNGLDGGDQFFFYDFVSSANGGAGNDTFFFYSGAQASNVAGGSGTDTLYATADTILTGSITEMESIGLQSVTLTVSSSTLANGFAAGTTISGTGTIVVNMDTAIFLGGQFVMNTAGVSFNIFGTSGSDIIKANINAVNVINGGDGDDQLRGGALADTINGGNDNDKIMGFTGADVLTGGTGNDQFRYFLATDSGLAAAADQITDFVIGTDRLNFVLIDADTVTADDQAFGFIGTGAFTNTGVGQIRFQNSGGDLLVQVDVDGNGTADMEVILQGLAGQTLTSADFML